MPQTPNIYEARVELVNTITDVLLDLADAGSVSGDELRELQRQMADVADAILEELGAAVLEVKDDGSYLLEVRPVLD